LEIGCEWGTTSAYLAVVAAQLVATDVSAECIERARSKNPDIFFETLDAFDLLAVQAHGPVDIVYMDVSGLSGFRSLLDVLALLNSYSNLLAPRVIVIKSGALVNLARRLSVAPELRDRS
jgi:trans-aconitate methyltransferase